MEAGGDFIMPEKILKTETNSSAVIGIKNFDFIQENAVLIISYALIPFADYPADHGRLYESTFETEI